MIETPTDYTTREGGDWLPWPFPKHVKPTNPDLLTSRPEGVRRIVMHVGPAAHCVIHVHSIKFDNGKAWDSINGWRP